MGCCAKKANKKILRPHSLGLDAWSTSKILPSHTM